MIPVGLEKFILAGKAEAKTWVHGVSGTGRIPIGEGQFIVIYHFDYFPFIDAPPDTAGLPATGNTTVTITLGTTDSIQFDVNGNTTAFFDIDTTDPANTLVRAQTQLSLILPGWTVSLVIIVNQLTFTLTSTNPGATFNGWLIDIVSAGGNPTIPGAMAGGVAASLTVEQVLARSTHQLEFRSKKSKNHFVIRDEVHVLGFSAVIAPPNNYTVNVTGSFSKDCYLVHEEFCAINILTIPDPDVWSITSYAELPPKSRETQTPAGYGQDPSGLNAVRAVLLGGLDQQYLPNTKEFETIVSSPTSYREQFKVDANDFNKLNNPQAGINLIRWNRRSYPIVNIDYVLFHFNINQFVQAS